MSIILSGSDGLSDVDGSASTPAIRGTDANTGIFFPAADTIAFAEGGTEVMRIDSSGNVGIGTSSPDGNLQVYKNAASSLIRVTSSTTGVTGVDFGDTDATDRGQVRYFNNGDYLLFATAQTERMRITSDGYFLINATARSGSEQMALRYSSNTGPGFNIRDTNAQNGNTFIQFNNGTTTAGQITSNGTTTMTYGSASDYRLKQNLVPMTGALEKINLLKPKIGEWKADGSVFQGFIAHELQEVFPDAVWGEKDKVDAEGNDVYQMIDTGSSSLIATLTAAIQELKSELDAAKARIAVLEAK